MANNLLQRSHLGFSETNRFVFPFWHLYCDEFTRASGGFMFRRGFLALVLVGISGLLFSSPALANNLHLCDISQFTQCNSGSAIAVTSSQAWAFGTSYTGDTLYLAVMNPLAGNGGNFSSSTNLWNVLNVQPSQVFPTFASTVSQEQGATGSWQGALTPRRSWWARGPARSRWGNR